MDGEPMDDIVRLEGNWYSPRDGAGAIGFMLFETGKKRKH